MRKPDAGVKLNILVLHLLDSFSGNRKTSYDHAHAYQRYAPAHNYFYYDIGAPVTNAFMKIRFHAVILDATALCVRYYRPRELFYALKDRWQFLAESSAVKIAFPQDDYDHSEVLDQWLDDYRVDILYTVLPRHAGLLYPRMSRRAQILPALTGYVNDADVENISAYARPFAQRTRDIGYRARSLPAQFGSYGQLKRLIAERMAPALPGRNLVADLSVRPEDTLLGDQWLKFLGDCRFCIGSEGGSSLWDPNGKIRDRVEEFVKDNPEAGYEEIEAACFPGLDRQHVFSAISPRLFEAAMVRCGQILVEAPYLDGVLPNQHYIPLKEDFSNLDEVLERAKDVAAGEKMAEACYQALIDTPAFRYSTHVTVVLDRIRDLVKLRNLHGSSTRSFERLRKKHFRTLEAERAADLRRRKVAERRRQVKESVQRAKLYVRQSLRRLILGR